MKRHLIILLLAIILFLYWTYFGYSQRYTDFSSFSGNAWNSYSDASKLGFTLGFIVGVHKALEELDLVIRQVSYENKIDELLPIYNITNTKLKEALDEFYSQSANMTIPIKDAVLIVCKEVRAKDKERIEKEKRLLRLPPEKRRLVKRIDYLKEKIKRGEYSGYELKREKVVEKSTGRIVPLNTEEDIVDFWTKQILPEEAPQVKEVVRVDYSLAIIVAGVALVIIVLILFLKKKRQIQDRIFR